MQYSDHIKQYISSFAAQLNQVNVDVLKMGDYEKGYLSHIINSSTYYTSIYAHLLSLVLQYTGKDKLSISLVDYGAGNGLLGIFAKYCGFGKVYINDLGKGATDAATELSNHLSITVDGFITGDTENLVSFFKECDRPDVITGMDVIEHIYNLDIFFSLLQSINPNMLTVLSTGANADNPKKAREFMKQQMVDELEGGVSEDNPLFGGATQPFIKLREAIIKEAAPLLTTLENQQLAKATRGLIKEDIIIAVKQYLFNKTLPSEISHPTNTCEPYTGSWSERLLKVKEYKTLYARHGYRLEAYSGFYNSYGKSFRYILKKMANLVIKATGYRFAPFITLVGYK